MKERPPGGPDPHRTMTLSTTLLLATLLPLAVALGHALGRRRAASAERAAAEPLAEGRLLASLSHEIRTPLNGIAGMTNFLVHSDLDSTQHECVHTIQSCVDSLLFLVNDVLDYSKLESGRMEFEHIEFDLGTQLEDAVEVFALEARAAGVVLLPDVPADRSWKYSGDPYRLRQIVLNFV
ncbi:MAG: hybrid sensor histidine kinase/response regulator, partial [Calditrichaeota bacterium]|nr:hybrid sensor histidine kinase/response regulator [Calditrichota bacterium]